MKTNLSKTLADLEKIINEIQYISIAMVKHSDDPSKIRSLAINLQDLLNKRGS